MALDMVRFEVRLPRQVAITNPLVVCLFCVLRLLAVIFTSIQFFVWKQFTGNCSITVLSMIVVPSSSYEYVAGRYTDFLDELPPLCSAPETICTPLCRLDDLNCSFAGGGCDECQHPFDVVKQGSAHEIFIAGSLRDVALADNKSSGSSKLNGKSKTRVLPGTSALTLQLSYSFVFDTEACLGP